MFFKTGIYRHFKGNEYKAIGVARCRMDNLRGAPILKAKNSEKPEESFNVFRVDGELAIEACDTRSWVIYQALYGDRDWWMRPESMFTELVVKPGYSGPRFEFLRSE